MYNVRINAMCYVFLNECKAKACDEFLRGDGRLAFVVILFDLNRVGMFILLEHYCYRILYPCI